MKNFLVIASYGNGLSVNVVPAKNKCEAMLVAKSYNKKERFTPIYIKRVSKGYVKTMLDIRASECPDEVFKEFE